MNELIDELIYRARQSTLKQFPEFAGVSYDTIWEVFGYELARLLVQDILAVVDAEAAYNETAERAYYTIKNTYKC